MSTAALTLGRPFALGRGPWKTLDPFLFCVFHDDQFPKSTANSLGPDPALLRGREITSDFSYKDGWSMYHGETVPGFPSHPHRGFETVTVVTKGLVDHFDSLGATGRYGNGDVQWLTTGDGVQHSEMFPLVNKDGPNPLELFQLWLNLPLKTKYTPAHFKMFWEPTVPKVTIGDATVTVVAGAGLGPVPPTPPPASWGSDPEGDVAIWVFKIKSGGSCTVPAAAKGRGANRAVYFFRGRSTVTLSQSADDTAEAKLKVREGIEVNAGLPCVMRAGDEGDAEVLILQGAPIGEPVVQHGPFVTTSREEMTETFRKYHATQFGGWPWPSHDHHHPREQQRFAKFPDGRIESAPAAALP